MAPNSQTLKQLEAWRATLTEREKRLHDLAAVELKKKTTMSDRPNDSDNGSYFADKSHAFRKWVSKQSGKS